MQPLSGKLTASEPAVSGPPQAGTATLAQTLATANSLSQAAASIPGAEDVIVCFGIIDILQVWQPQHMETELLE